ncbi:MAG: acetylornithine deacetylase [Gammaproteobacteria bacterium RIFCSPLOWO2_02_FULL_47_50]|nr:MAG: acetylornithine deacetylase [Gammaproteobacteria bacterium RIFCSPLOWO2_12_47_11]OGT80230.1 MAG: acetylornithine deacetylase [Gammaproteobacteria bacterium RIFCSPLOWO2_02_FULL_47_50]
MNNNVPAFMESFSRLIATPSVSSIDPLLDLGNREIIELLADWLADLGFRIELMTIPEYPKKLNLIACLGSGEGGLVLSGHTDTVPFDDGKWQQDPFTLTERDNRLYGLGSSDMKCFFPLVIDVIRNMDLKKLHQPLYILATADEESTMSGAQALADSGRKLGRYAMIGEPTGLKPVHMHKGIIIESIKLTGQAGHSSNPALGNSALEGMYAVISGLMAWRKKIQQQHTNDQFAVPVPTLNFGSIHGGDNPNRICAECTLIVDIRLMPDMKLEPVRAEMREVISRAVEGSGLVLEVHSVFNGAPSMHTDPGSEIVRLAEKLSGHASGSVAFSTEAPYLNSMGMQTVVFGPGDIDQAHQANEYIAMDRIQPMLDILQKMIGHFCVEENSYAN